MATIRIVKTDEDRIKIQEKKFLFFWRDVNPLEIEAIRSPMEERTSKEMLRIAERLSEKRRQSKEEKVTSVIEEFE